jgi:hypothetical protein
VSIVHPKGALDSLESVCMQDATVLRLEVYSFLLDMLRHGSWSKSIRVELSKLEELQGEV